MKVVSQLALHFWLGKRLTPSEARYLVAHGFVRGKDLPGYVETSNDATDANENGRIIFSEDPEPLDDLEVIQERFSRQILREKQASSD